MHWMSMLQARSPRGYTDVELGQMTNQQIPGTTTEVRQMTELTNRIGAIRGIYIQRDEGCTG
jgi:hypothetical protein